MNEAQDRSAPESAAAGQADQPALRLAGICKSFREGKSRLVVLDGADLSIHAGELVALIAPSGAGKSTLLHIAGLLESPDSGDIVIDGRQAGRLDDAGRTQLRRNHIGFVYQFHHLLPEFTAVENLVLPQMINGLSRRQAAQRAAELLDYMRMSDRGHHRPAELSGGERQRVAIARAVANAPRILLADEPTGNLDPRTADFVFEALQKLVRASGLAALMVTHNMELAGRMDRCVLLQDGRITDC